VLHQQVFAEIVLLLRREGAVRLWALVLLHPDIMAFQVPRQTIGSLTFELAIGPGAVMPLRPFPVTTGEVLLQTALLFVRESAVGFGAMNHLYIHAVDVPQMAGQVRLLLRRAVTRGFRTFIDCRVDVVNIPQVFFQVAPS